MDANGSSSTGSKSGEGERGTSADDGEDRLHSFVTDVRDGGNGGSVTTDRFWRVDLVRLRVRGGGGGLAGNSTVAIWEVVAPSGEDFLATGNGTSVWVGGSGN